MSFAFEQPNIKVEMLYILHRFHSHISEVELRMMPTFMSDPELLLHWRQDPARRPLQDIVNPDYYTSFNSRKEKLYKIETDPNIFQSGKKKNGNEVQKVGWGGHEINVQYMYSI